MNPNPFSHVDELLKSKKDILLPAYAEEERYLHDRCEQLQTKNRNRTVYFTSGIVFLIGALAWIVYLWIG